MKPLMLFVGVLCLVATASATTYVRVEKDGTKTYSDRPLPGGQPVDLQPAQSYTPPPPPSTPSTRVPREQQLLEQMDDFRYESCALTPATDETFTNPTEVVINVQLEPFRRPSDTITLTVDGRDVGDTLSYTLAPADRGSHTAQVVVRDTYGRVLCSASTTFHVLRPSIHMPRR